jgi:hypothetical protein
VEGQDEPTQGRFGRPVGLADPLWAHLDLCFRVVGVVGPKVSPRCPPEFAAVCLPVGPSILVMSMCRPLICRGCFPWIGVMACMHEILGGSPSLAEVMWLDP